MLESALSMIQEWSKSHPTQSASRIAELRYWTVESAALTAELNVALQLKLKAKKVKNQLLLLNPLKNLENKHPNAELTAKLETVNASLEAAKRLLVVDG